jgi:hypothetical protein
MKRVLLLLLISIVSFNTDAQFMRRKLKKRTAEAAAYGSVGYYGNPHWSVGANIQYLNSIVRKKLTGRKKSEEHRKKLKGKTFRIFFTLQSIWFQTKR